MDWENAEAFPDWTAAEAVCRAMVRDPARLEGMDDRGARLLADAVVTQAVEDYMALLRAGDPGGRAREAGTFFRSDWFRLLSGMDGEALIRRMRKEAGRQ